MMGATEPTGTTATEPAPTTCSHTFSEATGTVCGQVNVGYCPLSSNHRETPVGLKLVCQPTED